MALALVVLATFIGAPGLGDIVLRGMQRLNVGKALEGGLAIVLMAILLDRVTHAMGQDQQRTDKGLTLIFRLFPSPLNPLGSSNTLSSVSTFFGARLAGWVMASPTRLLLFLAFLSELTI